MRGRVIAYFLFSKRWPSLFWIFIFSQFLWKIQICASIFVVKQNLVKIGRCAAELLRIFDFRNGGRLPSWVFMFPQFLWKILICTYIFVIMQNLVKIGLSAAELLRTFDFQNGSHPPFLIWYDVLSDHKQLVFDGPNIFLKLHVDCCNILRDIAIFIFGPFGLKLPIHAHFGGYNGVPLGIGYRRKWSKN